MKLALAIIVVAGCYNPSYQDCEVTCTTNHGCPSGLSCDMTLGACRVPGAGATCGSTANDSSMDAAIDSSGCGFTLFSNFEPCSLIGNGDTTIDQLVVYNTDTGMVANGFPAIVPAGTLVTPTNAPPYRLLDYNSFLITPVGALQLVGFTPLVIAAHTVRVEGVIDLTTANSRPDMNRCNASEGSGNNYSGGGGGGGGLAAAGGRGGEGGDAGAQTGRAIGGNPVTGAFAPLLASCPGRKGGASGDSVAGSAGAAGGSIQITARDSITVSGSIRANGGGGGGGTSVTSTMCAGGPCGAGGGGGGAGGIIFLESPMVTVAGTAKLCANGGGGGGGAGTNPVGSATGGGSACAVAAGLAGAPTGGGGGGGTGGYTNLRPGQPGSDNNGVATSGGGGGGGSVGRIGVRATTASVAGTVLSPTVEMLQ